MQDVSKERYLPPKRGFLHELNKNKILFFMLIPTLLYFLINNYLPMIGIYYAFVQFDFFSRAWRNPEFMLFEPSYDGVEAIFNELDKIQVPDIYTGFAEDYSSYQAERAALEQVEKQYLFPLMAGLVDNVEDGLNTFMEKAKQAGLDKIQESYKQQWLQYLQESGLK